MGTVAPRLSQWSVTTEIISMTVEPTLTMDPSNGSSYRRLSLKEQPSYIKEVSKALTRREQLLKLKQRLGSESVRDLDPATKPWLRRSSSSQGSPTPPQESPSPPQSIKSEDIVAPPPPPTRRYVQKSSMPFSSMQSQVHDPQHMDRIFSTLSSMLQVDIQ